MSDHAGSERAAMSRDARIKTLLPGPVVCYQEPPRRRSCICGVVTRASWRSGYAEDCKSLYGGSIPSEASTITHKISNFGFPDRESADPQSAMPTGADLGAP